MNNLEKLLIFISDEKLVNEMIASLERLSGRSSNDIDIKRVKDKLKNIRKLCREKQLNQS